MAEHQSAESGAEGAVTAASALGKDAFVIEDDQSGTDAVESGAAGFADAETREILNLLNDGAAGCCGGSCCS